MFGFDRRKTVGTQKQSTARTPTKATRFTDVGATSSVKKSAGRFSLSQTSGPRLSLFQRPGTTIQRDVKALVNENVHKIHSFMVIHEEDAAIPEKGIRSPKGRNEFVIIFELIYQHVSKSFEVPPSSRLEDVIPPIFKALGYPIQLKNSYFQPLGTPLGYPYLLDALAWLVDLVNMTYEVGKSRQDILMGECFEEKVGTERAVSYSWLTMIYKEYSNDRNQIYTQNYVEDKSRKLREFLAKDCDYEDAMISAKSMLEQLIFECDELEGDKGSEQKLKKDISDCRNDVRKASDYALSLETILNNVEQSMILTKNEAKQVEDILKEIENEISEIHLKIEKQKETHGLSGEAVRAMNCEIQKDKEMFREKQAYMENLTKEIWNTSNKSQFKEQQKAFGLVLNKIHHLANGTNITVDIDRLPENEDELELFLEEVMKKWLPMISEEWNKKRIETETMRSKIFQKVELVKERAQIESEMLEEAKKKEAREERIRRKQKEEWREERSEWDRKIQNMENEKEILEEKLQKSGHLEKQITEEKEKYEKAKQIVAEKRANFERVIKEKIGQIVSNATEIETQRMAYKVYYDEIEERVKNLKSTL